MALSTKLIAGSIIGVVAVVVVTLSYRHYVGLVDANASLSEQVASLKADVAREAGRADGLELAVGRWDEASRLQADALDRLARANADAGKYSRELRDELSRHDLAALARAKPHLIEGRVNAGSARALRMLEQSTQAAAADRAGPAAGADAAAAGAGKPRAH